MAGRFNQHMNEIFAICIKLTYTATPTLNPTAKVAQSDHILQICLEYALDENQRQRETIYVGKKKKKRSFQIF